MRHPLVSLALIALVALASPPASAAKGVGEQAPSFQAPLLAGGEFDLGAYLGKKAILLDWWSINCGPCVQAIPALIELSNKYPNDLVVVGMNVDAFILKRVSRFLETQKFKLTYPTVIDKQLAVMKQYDSSILPTTILIDKKGKIVYQHVGYKPGDEVEIEAKIKGVLGTP
ncbi:MAG: TlpA family protein disulfide reductase [Deferrisomatales bacterium]